MSSVEVVEANDRRVVHMVGLFPRSRLSRMGLKHDPERAETPTQSFLEGTTLSKESMQSMAQSATGQMFCSCDLGYDPEKRHAVRATISVVLPSVFVVPVLED